MTGEIVVSRDVSLLELKPELREPVNGTDPSYSRYRILRTVTRNTCTSVTILNVFIWFMLKSQHNVRNILVMTDFFKHKHEAGISCDALTEFPLVICGYCASFGLFWLLYIFFLKQKPTFQT